MDKILFDSVDVNVAGTYVYVSEGIAYKDAEGKLAFTTAALKNVFLKGAVIVDGDLIYKPISFGLADDTGVLTYVTADTTTATTAVLATVSADDGE